MDKFTRITRSPWYHAAWFVWCAGWAIGYAWAREPYWLAFWVAMMLLWGFYIGKWLVHHSAKPKFTITFVGMSSSQLSYVERKLKQYPNAEVSVNFKGSSK